MTEIERAMRATTTRRAREYDEWYEGTASSPPGNAPPGMRRSTRWSACSRAPARARARRGLRHGLDWPDHEAGVIAELTAGIPSNAGEWGIVSVPTGTSGSDTRDRILKMSTDVAARQRATCCATGLRGQRAAAQRRRGHADSGVGDDRHADDGGVRNAGGLAGLVGLSRHRRRHEPDGGRSGAAQSQAIQVVDVSGQSAASTRSARPPGWPRRSAATQRRRQRRRAAHVYLGPGSRAGHARHRAGESGDRGNVTTLLPRSVAGAVPVGTRAMRVTVTAKRTQGLNKRWLRRNLSLTLDVAAATAGGTGGSGGTGGGPTGGAADTIARSWTGSRRAVALRREAGGARRRTQRGASRSGRR